MNVGLNATFPSKCTLKLPSREKNVYLKDIRISSEGEQQGMTAVKKQKITKK